MATSPSISASVTQRCKIHDGSVTQNGIVSWSVEGQAEAAFNATKANYFTDTSGWYSRYYWSGASGTKTFTSETTVSCSTTITVYTKSIVATSESGYYNMWATEANAMSECNSVPGSASYYLTYSFNSSDSSWRTYKHNLSISTSSSTKTVSTNVSTSGYVDRTYTDPYVTGVSVGSSSLTIDLYTSSSASTTYSISTYNPGGVSFSPSVSASSSNSNVASASASGGRVSITGYNTGSATITVSSGGKSATISVTVKDTTPTVTNPYVRDVAYSYTMAGLGTTYSGVSIGETETMDCHLYLTNPNGLDFNPSYSVTNSDSTVMSCSYTLRKTSTTTYDVVLTVKGLKAGSTTVTVSSNGHSASLTFVIKSTPSISSWQIYSNSIDANIINLNPGEVVTMTVGSQTKTQISTSGGSMLIYIMPLSSSTTYNVTITTDMSGTLFSGTKTTSAPSPSVSSVTIAGDETYSLITGDTRDITYSITISNDNSSYTPTTTVVSSNTNVVSITNLSQSRKAGSFKINALAAGVATITVTASGKTDTITVNVTSSSSGGESSGRKGAYIGIKPTGSSSSGIARKVTGAYIGINNGNTDTARRIKKAYIGIGGIARPCFGDDGLTYYGTIASLSVKRSGLAATTVGSYALFGGGSNAGTCYKNVEAYDASLTRQAATDLGTGRYYLAATTIGNHALFGGGQSSSYYSNVDAYDELRTRTTVTSLSTTRALLSAVTVGGYALFGGGQYNTTNRSTVNAYDESLTRSTPTSLSSGRYGLASAAIGNYALFGGGQNASYSTVVDAYDDSLTRSKPTSLSKARSRLSATTVGTYALFCGGHDTSVYGYDRVDAYNTSLTRTTAPATSVAHSNFASTSLGEYALFGGGRDASNGMQAVVDVYDKSLTLTTTEPLSVVRESFAAVSIGNFALFGGGYNSSTGQQNTVDAYTCERPTITINLVVLKTVSNTLYTTQYQTVPVKAKAGMRYFDLAFDSNNTVVIPNSNGNTLTVTLSGGYTAWKYTTSNGATLTVKCDAIGSGTLLTDGMTLDMSNRNLEFIDLDISTWNIQ